MNPKFLSGLNHAILPFFISTFLVRFEPRSRRTNRIATRAFRVGVHPPDRKMSGRLGLREHAVCPRFQVDAGIPGDGLEASLEILVSKRCIAT
jgi:hypothetical protein